MRSISNEDNRTDMTVKIGWKPNGWYGQHPPLNTGKALVTPGSHHFIAPEPAAEQCTDYLEEKIMTLCPATHCGHVMEADIRGGYDACFGLEYLYCPHCGHRGLKARNGAQLLFTGQHEYLFSYGPSLSHLKVVLSTVAINLFQTQGMPPAQLAAHVADWALLMGQVCGTVRFSGDLVHSSCYEYCRREATKSPAVSSL